MNQTKNPRRKQITKTQQRLPDWFRVSKGKLNATKSLSNQLMADVPNSICEEAKCPNRFECFKKGVLTFMIMGTTCTRNCAFCSVAHGKPLPPDPQEVTHIFNAIEKLNLKFVVITSPNRDDLPDGGASHYAHIIQSIKSRYPHVKVEVLIPDFQGDMDALATVVAANPDVLNHNMETVPGLYTVAKRGSLFKRSLSILSETKRINPKMLTKSGLMVGLSETTEELHDTFNEIYKSNVDILTIGQYLQPNRDNLPVSKYYALNEFDELKAYAENLGFRFVFSGPLVRSSYLAEHVFEDVLIPVPKGK
jgi:lipoic acid synthetase